MTVTHPLEQRWLLGTQRSAVTRQDLDACLNDFTLRFNRRRRMLVSRLLEQRSPEPISYRNLIVDPSPTGRHPARVRRPAPGRDPDNRSTSLRDSPGNPGYLKPIDSPSRLHLACTHAVS